jgi:hypothetical protein
MRALIAELTDDCAPLLIGHLDDSLRLAAEAYAKAVAGKP